jgi:hypothetical protein
VSVTLNDDFLDMLDALTGAQVEFVIVGAYALAVHGVPRATGDIDVLVRPSAENAHRVMQALTTFGAPTQQLTDRDLATPDLVFQIGLPPRRIDLLTGIDGVSFDDVWATRLEVEVDGRALSFIGREALLVNKRASGRASDLADVERLLAGDAR